MFIIPPEQFARQRRHAIAAGLVESFEKSGVSANYNRETGVVDLADKTRFGFDQQGFIGRVDSPLGRRWCLRNDEQGRLLEMTNPAGFRTGFTLNEQGLYGQIRRNDSPALDLAYDHAGNISSIRFPDGSQTRFRYRKGRLVGRTSRGGAGERYRYGQQGELLEVVDANGHAGTFGYDAAHLRPTEARFAAGNREGYQYDDLGRVTRIEATDGQPIAEVTYGKRPEPADIRWGDGEVCRFKRDGRGNLLEASNNEAVCRFEYDDQDRLIRETSNEDEILHHYDGEGNRIGMTLPGGEKIGFSYDPDHRLTGVVDWFGNRHSFTYDPENRDRFMGWSAPNGIHTETRLNPSGLPLSQVTRKAGNPVFSRSFAYDGEDRLKAFDDSEWGSRRFEYDPDGRLTSVYQNQSQLRERFSYSPAGDRLTNNERTFAYDPGNRLKGGSYDGRGNQTRTETPTGIWELQYNARNLLVAATSDRGVTLRFGYDAFGRRLWKKGPNGLTRFLWCGEQLIGEIHRGVTRGFLYHPTSQAPLVMRLGRDTYCYHNDHLGTPQRLTDVSGRVVWRADYDVFGRASIHRAKVDNPLRFPGQYEDEETGLHYNRFRYYAPDLGRYLSPDPLGLIAGLNFYCYVDNDPVNGADPMGLFWKSALCIAGAVLAGVAAVAAIVTIGAPLALGVLVAGAVGGAVYGGLNQALNGKFSLECILKAMGKGFVKGLVTALPFAALALAPVLLPLGAATMVTGVTGYAVAGGVSGGLGYATDVAMGDADWDWGQFSKSVAFGVATGGLSRYLKDSSMLKKVGADSMLGGAEYVVDTVTTDAQFSLVGLLNATGTSGARSLVKNKVEGRFQSKVTPAKRLPQDKNVNPSPPKAQFRGKKIAKCPVQNKRAQDIIRRARAEGATDIRVNQQQVNVKGVRVGINRPDIQYTLNGKRVYIEIDSPESKRGPIHDARIKANDPDAEVTLIKITKAELETAKNE